MQAMCRADTHCAYTTYVDTLQSINRAPTRSALENAVVVIHIERYKRHIFGGRRDGEALSAFGLRRSMRSLSPYMLR